MPRFRNYYNKFGKHNRIYSMDELYKMPMGDFIDKEDELDYQDRTIGLPFDDELKSSKNVRFIDGFTQDDGNVIPSRWESFAPIKPNNSIEESLPGTGGIAGNANVNPKQELPELMGDEPLVQHPAKIKTFGMKPYKNDISEPFSKENDKLPDNTFDILKQQPQEDKTLSDDLLAQNKTDIDIIKPLEDNKPQNIQLPEQIQKPVEQVEQSEQPKLSQNLKDYINDLVGENIDYGFIGNKAPTSSQPDVPIYPENGVLKGGVETTDIEDNVFRKPLEPIQDFINKVINNGTDYSVPKTKWEKIQEKIYTEWFNKDFPMASNATKDGMKDFETSKKDKNATVNSSLKELNDENLQKALKKYGATDEMKGIHYNSDSSNSKKIIKSTEMKEIVDDFCKNGGKTTKTSFEFKFDIKQPKDSIDRYASIQHAKIFNPQISKDGNFMEGKVIDISDFEKRDTDNPINIPNNWGYNMQEKNQYKNYFTIIDIKIPLTEEQKKLLKNNSTKY